MEDSAAPQSYDNNQPEFPAAEHSPARSLSRIARPALIVSVIIAIICVVLLGIVFMLDSFNATVYSVNGKDIQDATDEAREIRDSYAGARIAAVIGLSASAVVAIASAVVLYLNRGTMPADDEGDGEDVDFDDLAGR